MLATLVAVVGFGLLGAVDDLAGDVERKGFRGHLEALLHGRLTTGGLKLVGGLAVSALAVSCVTNDVGVLDVVIVAGAANLGNLFDRAPGRVIKVSVLALAVLVALTREHLDGAALVVGAGVGLLAFDLRERLMLGDTGANVLGAALGVAVVTQDPSTVATAAVAAVLVALNLVSERVSFSRVIAATPPLRWVDGMGRSRTP